MRKLVPNSTQIPDAILDEWMAKLSGAEFKVVMFIARKTFGWGKEADTLSVSQIEAGTGLSARAILAACARLEHNNGPIVRIPSPLPKGHPRAFHAFALNTEWDGGDLPPASDFTGAKKSPVETPAKTSPVQNLHVSPAKKSPVVPRGPVQKGNTQETEETLYKRQSLPSGGGRADALAPLKVLLAAFRLARFGPNAPSFSQSDFNAFRPNLAALHADGRSADEVRQATLTAVRRWGGTKMVTVRSVCRHFDALLEPDLPHGESATRRGNGDGGGSSTHQSKVSQSLDAIAKFQSDAERELGLSPSPYLPHGASPSWLQ